MVGLLSPVCSFDLPIPEPRNSRKLSSFLIRTEIDQEHELQIQIGDFRFSRQLGKVPGQADNLPFSPKSQSPHMQLQICDLNLQSEISLLLLDPEQFENKCSPTELAAHLNRRVIAVIAEPHPHFAFPF